jgi:hypothetical protein
MPRASEPVRNVYVGPDSNSTGVGISSCFGARNQIGGRKRGLNEDHLVAYDALRLQVHQIAKRINPLFQHWSRPDSQQLRRTRHRKAVAVSASRGGFLMRTVIKAMRRKCGRAHHASKDLVSRVRCTSAQAPEARHKETRPNHLHTTLPRVPTLLSTRLGSRSHLYGRLQLHDRRYEPTVELHSLACVLSHLEAREKF